MTKFPRLCRNCSWSVVNENALRCANPIVYANDYWVLSSNHEYAGTSCRSEREQKWFEKCGMEGKLYEERVNIRRNVDSLRSQGTGVG